MKLQTEKVKWKLLSRVRLFATQNSEEPELTFPFSRGSSQLRDKIQVSCIAGGFFISWATREAQEYWSG